MEGIIYRCRHHRELALRRLQPPGTTGQGYLCWEQVPLVALFLPGLVNGEDIYQNHDGSHEGGADIRAYTMGPAGLTELP